MLCLNLMQLLHICCILSIKWNVWKRPLNHDKICKLCKARPNSRVHLPVWFTCWLLNNLMQMVCFAGKYESHTRVHTGEKPFECDICHQCYSTKSNLTVHRKRHNNEIGVHKKEHKCLYCNKLHATKKTLVKHVKRQVWV